MYPHSEGVHADGDLPADPAEPEDGERLAVQLRAGVERAVPAAGAQGGGSRHYMPRKVQDQAASQLASTECIGTWCTTAKRNKQSIIKRHNKQRSIGRYQMYNAK